MLKRNYKELCEFFGVEPCDKAHKMVVVVSTDNPFAVVHFEVNGALIDNEGGLEDED